MSSRLKTLNSLFNSPLSIARSASSGLKFTLSLFLEMRSFAEADIKAKGFATRGERPATDWDGEPIQQMTIENGIAVIPVKGVMASDVPTWAKQIGYCDVMDVLADINRAQSSGVRGMLFDHDSPGGATMAGHQLFDTLNGLRDKMPLAAYASGTMASASFQGALPVHALMASPYSVVGSIGTYSLVVDDDKFWEDMGISFEVIASGKFKGMGITSLTDDQRQWVKNMVNDLGNQFRANVSQYRPNIAAADMEGQWFDGKDAGKRGFVDSLQNNLQNALAFFSDKIDHNK